MDVRRCRVRIERPSIESDLVAAGWPAAEPDGGVFMMKPLASDVSIWDARRLLGVGTGRFTISRLRIT